MRLRALTASKERPRLLVGGAAFWRVSHGEHITPLRLETLVPILLGLADLGIFAVIRLLFFAPSPTEQEGWILTALGSYLEIYFGMYLSEDREDNWRAIDQKHANMSSLRAEKWGNRAIRRAEKRRGLL